MSMAALVTSDGRFGSLKANRSSKWAQDFSSCHCNITSSKLESRERAQIKAGNPENVNDLVQAFTLCEK